MAHRSKKGSSFLSAVLPFRGFIQKLIFIFILTLALAILIIGKSEHTQMVKLRAALVDITLPLLRVVTLPVDGAVWAANTLHDAVFVFQENKYLRAQNARYARMQTITAQLHAENRRLRQMVHFIPEPEYNFITARVVADISSPFTRATMINAGEENGVEAGQVVLSEKGLVGRVLEVGEGSARVLLLNDVNSRVPVITSNSQERGILTGDNLDNPLIRHLPIDSEIQVGESVLTSGDGRFFPAGIPVGVVKEVKDDKAIITLFVHPRQLEYVNVVKFNVLKKEEEAATAP